MQAKGKETVGAVKICMSKTTPLTDVTAGYISAVSQEHCRQNLFHKGIFNPALCSVIDVGGMRVFPGVKSTAARLKDVESACQNLAVLWDSVKENE